MQHNCQGRIYSKQSFAGDGMKFIAVNSPTCFLTTGNPADVVTILPASVTNPNMTIDHFNPYHIISFTLTLSSGATGAGVLNGTSVSTKGDYMSFVLEQDSVQVETIQPGTPPTPGPVVTVFVQSAGQTSTMAD